MKNNKPLKRLFRVKTTEHKNNDHTEIHNFLNQSQQHIVQRCRLMEYRWAKQYEPLKLHYIKIERYLSTGTLQVFEKRDEMICLNGSALYILKKHLF